MRFISVDLETANPRMSSICQIGVVTFENGKEVDAEVRLVDPQDYFDPYNVAIHGITENQVRGPLRHARDRRALIAILFGHFERGVENALAICRRRSVLSTRADPFVLLRGHFGERRSFKVTQCSLITSGG